MSFMDVLLCGCVDVLLCGCVALWMCCFVDVLPCGCVVKFASTRITRNGRKPS